MKTEKEIRQYADEVIAEIKKYKEAPCYMKTQAKTILGVLMYILEDYCIADINRL